MEEKRAFSQLNEIPGGGYSINKPGAAFNAPFRHDESHHDAVEAWSSLTNTFKSFDERMVLEWKEDIDALLVFAGLFSAVVTAFVTEAYQMLQPDPMMTSVQLLANISLQLNNVSSNLIQPDIDSNFTAPKSAIRINTLWFTSLVFSLISALLGILAKQWLRRYISHTSSAPREAIQIRQHRYNGLIKWRMIEIVGWLPVLLEIAVVLFFVGLIEFLWQLDRIVASIVTSFIGLSLLFFAITTIAPAFSTNCPFKSPQAFGFCTILWTIFGHNRLLERDFRFWRTFDKMAGDDHLPETWREREIAAVKETGSVLEVSALAWLSHTYSGDDVLDQMVPCISELKNRRAVRLIAHFIATNAQATFMELLADLPHDRPISLPLPPRCRARFEKAAEIGGPKSVHRIINAFADVLPTVLWIDGGHDHLTPVQILNILHVVLLCSDKELNPLFGGEALNEQVYNRLTGFLLDRIHRSNAALGAADEARQLLIHLGTYGCHKDYTPQRNAIQCALDAYASNDLPLFISTSCAALPPLVGKSLPEGTQISDDLYSLVAAMGEFVNMSAKRKEVLPYLVQRHWVDWILSISPQQLKAARIQKLLKALVDALEFNFMPTCEPLNVHRLRILLLEY
ncbi:hypothetical protein C8Q75DRAFT_776544 [Abortiporus biennis]|nr:hypothetical protein C8Q75DRAFT_776544 [Abortiporus biennis]